MLSHFQNQIKSQNIQVDKIQSIKNIVEYDSSAQKKKYSMQVNFVDKDGDKLQYKYSKKEGEDSKTKILGVGDQDQDHRRELDSWWDRTNKRFLNF